MAIHGKRWNLLSIFMYICPSASTQWAAISKVRARAHHIIFDDRSMINRETERCLHVWIRCKGSKSPWSNRFIAIEEALPRTLHRVLDYFDMHVTEELVVVECCPTATAKGLLTTSEV